MLSLVRARWRTNRGLFYLSPRRWWKDARTLKLEGLDPRWIYSPLRVYRVYIVILNEAIALSQLGSARVPALFSPNTLPHRVCVQSCLLFARTLTTYVGKDKTLLSLSVIVKYSLLWWHFKVAKVPWIFAHANRQTLFYSCRLYCYYFVLHASRRDKSMNACLVALGRPRDEREWKLEPSYCVYITPKA